MKNNFLKIILGLVWATSVFAQEVEFSGDIETLWGVGAPWTDEDEATGKFTLANTAFTGKLDAYYNNSSAFAEATFTYDATGAFNGADGSGNLGGGFDISLGELWIDYTSSFWGIRIGRQKAVWGKADGIDITNVLCPADMSSLSAMVGDDSKLPVDAIRFSLSGNQFTADAYWIPFFNPAALPLDEDNNLRKFLVPSSVSFPIPAMNTSLTLPVSINQFERSELAIWNGEYGIKLSGYFSILDFSLYGYYGWDDLPLLDYSMTYGAPLDPTNPASAMPNGIVVSGDYKRMAMIGTDAALPIGPTVLRLEAAFFPQRYFQKSAEEIMKNRSESSEKHNQLSVLAGIDWMPGGWTITAQYYCDVVFGDIERLDRANEYQHGATLSLSKSLVNETLELSLAGLIGFNDFDSMISPSVKYSLSDQINLGLKAFIFLPGPDNDGKYGAYKDLSSICVNAKFSF